jgi:alkaline phosphatase D
VGRNGLGLEPNNLTAIRSLIAYRALRYGKHLDLLITDQHSFCGDDPSDAEEVGKIYDPSFRGYFSEEAMIALDAGRAFDGGKPPAELQFRDVRISNPSKDKRREPFSASSRKHGSRRNYGDRRRPGRSGVIRSERSTTAWTCKICRLECQKSLARGHLRDRQQPTITARLMPSARRSTTSCGTRRSPASQSCLGTGTAFWAGYACSRAPAAEIRARGLSFVGASLTSPGTMEALEHGLRKDHPLRALVPRRPAGWRQAEWTNNMLLRHGVRSCLEYAKSFDLKRARALSNPQLAPHLEFVDWAAMATRRCG